MPRTLFEYLGALGLVAVAIGLCCCAPENRAYRSTEGADEYQMKQARLVDDDGDFDLRKTVIYAKTEGTTFDPSLNVSNKELTMKRCAWCHECGFPAAWDTAHLDTPEWKPRYKGQAWEPIVRRMRVMDGSMLNEEIADRIYSYLKQASNGEYDETKDTKGAVIREAKPGQTEFTIESPTTAAKRREAEQKKAEEASKTAPAPSTPPASGGAGSSPSGSH